jgi:hypothetical protein
MECPYYQSSATTERPACTEVGYQGFRIAPARDPLQRVLVRAANQHRRSRLLHRFGIADNVVEMDILAVKRRGWLRPELAHRRHVLRRLGPTMGEVRPQRLGGYPGMPDLQPDAVFFSPQLRPERAMPRSPPPARSRDWRCGTVVHERVRPCLMHD